MKTINIAKLRSGDIMLHEDDFKVVSTVHHCQSWLAATKVIDHFVISFKDGSLANRIPCADVTVLYELPI